MNSKAIGINLRKYNFIGKEIWKFEKNLQCYECYLNCMNSVVVRKYWYQHRSIKLGLSIPPNVLRGLRINHYGNIVVNSDARIGEWRDIHQVVNIGTRMDGGFPALGNNVWIRSGGEDMRKNYNW